MTAGHELVFEAPPPPRRPARRRVEDRPKRDHPPRSDYVAPDSNRPHGTYTKYVMERCRCEPCREANRTYESHRYRAMSRPDEVWMPYVPAAQARTHLRELAAAGVGYKTVARLAGLADSTVGKILWPSRYRGMGTSKGIRAETERAILSVSLEMAAGAQKVPAGPTWRLLDDLIARGFYKTWIARELRGPQARALQVRRDLVRASTARKVEELHRRCAGMAPPPKRSRWST